MLTPPGPHEESSDDEVDPPGDRSPEDCHKGIATTPRSPGKSIGRLPGSISNKSVPPIYTFPTERIRETSRWQPLRWRFLAVVLLVVLLVSLRPLRPGSCSVTGLRPTLLSTPQRRGRKLRSDHGQRRFLRSRMDPATAPLVARRLAARRTRTPGLVLSGAIVGVRLDEAQLRARKRRPRARGGGRRARDGVLRPVEVRGRYSNLLELLKELLTTR
jgi:hypothetical protein